MSLEKARLPNLRDKIEGTGVGKGKAQVVKKVGRFIKSKKK